MDAHTEVRERTFDNRTDEELIPGFLAGNPEVMEEFARRVRQWLPRCVYHWVKVELWREDAESESWIHIQKGLPGYDPRGGEFTTWAYRVAYNTTMNYIRDIQLNRKEVSYENLAEDALVTSDEPAGGYTACRVREELDGIEDKLQAIVYLKFNWGMSVEEIAEMLDLTYAQARYLLELAKLKLKPRLGGDSCRFH